MMIESLHFNIKIKLLMIKALLKIVLFFQLKSFLTSKAFEKKLFSELFNDNLL